MGIDIHGLNLLRYARAKSKPFCDVAMIGRQRIHVSNKVLISATDLHSHPKQYDYCEALLLSDFRASSVESFDASGYEGATHVADFNKPLPPSKVYDTVIDFGSCEHVFDIAQALRNVDSLCKVGGQLLHMLPANNFCGHGFWQFSSELFFSLYSEKNGYSETEIFLIDHSNTKMWYKVNAPDGRERVNVKSRTPVYVACRTVKDRTVNGRSVQQSDYVYIWNGSNHTHATDAKKENFLRKRWEKLNAELKRKATARLSPRNPQLLACKVEALVSSPCAHPQSI